jgi:hypothetical protein
LARVGQAFQPDVSLESLPDLPSISRAAPLS